MRTLERMKTYLVTTTPDASLREAADLMDLYQSSVLPVVDAEGVLVGVLTERDLVDAVAGRDLPLPDASRRHELNRMLVQEIMNRSPVSVKEAGDLSDAATLLLSRDLKRLPVTDEAGRVTGLLTRVDVLQAMLEGDI